MQQPKLPIGSRTGWPAVFRDPSYCEKLRSRHEGVDYGFGARYEQWSCRGAVLNIPALVT